MSLINDFFKSIWKLIKSIYNLITIFIFFIVLSIFISFAIITSPICLIIWPLFRLYKYIFYSLIKIIINRTNNIC
jgi:hypothetical protein